MNKEEREERAWTKRCQLLSLSRRDMCANKTKMITSKILNVVKSHNLREKVKFSRTLNTDRFTTEGISNYFEEKKNHFEKKKKT